FSSRRRHTRFSRDWSSDVCSSDLWLDSTILDALYGWGFGWNRPYSNFNALMGLNNAFGDMLLNFVMATMFIVLPSFWIGALAWAGVRAGNIAQMTMHATDDAKAAGGKAANKLI